MNSRRISRSLIAAAPLALLLLVPGVRNYAAAGPDASTMGLGPGPDPVRVAIGPHLEKALMANPRSGEKLLSILISLQERRFLADPEAGALAQAAPLALVSLRESIASADSLEQTELYLKAIGEFMYAFPVATQYSGVLGEMARQAEARRGVIEKALRIAEALEQGTRKPESSVKVGGSKRRSNGLAGGRRAAGGRSGKKIPAPSKGRTSPQEAPRGMLARGVALLSAGAAASIASYVAVDAAWPKGFGQASAFGDLIKYGSVGGGLYTERWGLALGAAGVVLCIALIPASIVKLPSWIKRSLPAAAILGTVLVGAGLGISFLTAPVLLVSVVAGAVGGAWLGRWAGKKSRDIVNKPVYGVSGFFAGIYTAVASVISLDNYSGGHWRSISFSAIAAVAATLIGAGGAGALVGYGLGKVVERLSGKDAAWAPAVYGLIGLLIGAAGGSAASDYVLKQFFSGQGIHVGTALAGLGVGAAVWIDAAAAGALLGDLAGRIVGLFVRREDAGFWGPAWGLVGLLLGGFAGLMTAMEIVWRFFA